jgi:hypothetical protein
MDGCDVYFNLARKVWSVRDRQTGLVARHARVVAFPFGARLIVNPAGHQKVLQTGQKNVHAFVRGTRAVYSADVGDWREWLDGIAAKGGMQITYNPRVSAHFTRRDTGARVDAVTFACMIAEEGKPPVVWGVAV